ncbi:hypothetical protein RCZ15_13820 [Capnocytophaga catalasegens]|uniref:Type IX secretion system protein PorV domain-containing protein n=1 Tax=Capnocytophaga catalasegens TaxID=1004260 RepID=A0AAV5AV47_9FLAO|nr:hypothetical protein RCZ03_19940 [Capnocytophaga catalasegens]GJM50409.1 hypothetical protein RCZ15_13820 [Capnocytophaga catalasegens]GJM51797.1 hypothetical protein RCZ16_01150 [Capnocytophaga catalasegens]
MNDLANITFFRKNIQKESAWSGSLIYFNGGKVYYNTFTNEQVIWQNQEIPYEFYIDMAYGLKISNSFSMAVTSRYIHSNLSLRSHQERSIANIFAFGISGFFSSETKFYQNFDFQYRLGFGISNIGGKATYHLYGKEYFLPTQLKVGGSVDFVKNNHTFTYALEFTKLLVPLSPQYGYKDENANGQQNIEEETIILKGKNPNCLLYKA